MADLIGYIVLFIVGISMLSMTAKYLSRHRRTWQACAQKYRLAFKEGKEEKSGSTVYVYRLKGYYRTCQITISASPTRPAETVVTVNYPKNLLDNLSIYPAGTLNRVTKALARQVTAKSSSANWPFFVTLPTMQSGVMTEVQRELNPFLKERIIQLMMVGSGKNRKMEVTDAYLVSKQMGFTKDPAELFPLIDEMLNFINVLEGNVTELFVRLEL